MVDYIHQPLIFIFSNFWAAQNTPARYSALPVAFSRNLSRDIMAC
jgi:hypothetical protein